MTRSAKASLRRAVVVVTVGSFSVAALLGIVALLGGGDFGDTELQLLGTTVVSGCASMLALTYLAAYGGRPPGCATGPRVPGARSVSWSRTPSFASSRPSNGEPGRRVTVVGRSGTSSP